MPFPLSPAPPIECRNLGSRPPQAHSQKREPLKFRYVNIFVFIIVIVHVVAIVVVATTRQLLRVLVRPRNTHSMMGTTLGNI